MHFWEWGISVIRLEAYRKACGLTYDALGLALGRDGTQAQRYCKAVTMPRRDVAGKMAEVTHGVIHAGNYADEIDEAEADAMMAEIAARADRAVTP